MNRSDVVEAKMTWVLWQWRRTWGIRIWPQCSRAWKM